MSAGSIVLAIVVVILLVVLIGTAVGISVRRRRLQARFGPEYDRAVADHKSRRLAEAELSSRERRVQNLALTELSDEARASYAANWNDVQEHFVEAPPEAVAQAQSLIESVMTDRGYPTDTYEDSLTDLSVHHAPALDHFRSAHDVSDKASRGQATTEELRTAMLNYRELFDQLVGQDTANGVVVDPTPDDNPEPEFNADADVAPGDRVSAS